MTEADFKRRTREFALGVLRLVEGFPKVAAGQVIGRQLLRCGTSVGANYRAACRARSEADMMAKLGIVEEEADEAGYWMELAVDAGLIERERVGPLWQEANDIVAMTVASIRRLKAKRK